MKVKVNDVWYDSEETPICLQMSEIEQLQIADMDRSVATEGKYASAPAGCFSTSDEFKAWME